MLTDDDGQWLRSLPCWIGKHDDDDDAPINCLLDEPDPSFPTVLVVLTVVCILSVFVNFTIYAVMVAKCNVLQESTHAAEQSPEAAEAEEFDRRIKPLIKTWRIFITLLFMPAMFLIIFYVVPALIDASNFAAFERVESCAVVGLDGVNVPSESPAPWPVPTCANATIALHYLSTRQCTVELDLLSCEKVADVRRTYALGKVIEECYFDQRDDTECRLTQPREVGFTLPIIVLIICILLLLIVFAEIIRFVRVLFKVTEMAEDVRQQRARSDSASVSMSSGAATRARRPSSAVVAYRHRSRSSSEVTSATPTSASTTSTSTTTRSTGHRSTRTRTPSTRSRRSSTRGNDLYAPLSL